MSVPEQLALGWEPARIELLIASVLPASLETLPPVDAPEKVLLVTVNVPLLKLSISPPWLAVLPEKVLLVTLAGASSL